MVSNGSDEELLARSPFLREGNAQVWTSIAHLGEHRTIEARNSNQQRLNTKFEAARWFEFANT
jgi:hypothetical protein